MPSPDASEARALADHIRALMARRRWSERDLALRMMDGGGIGVACVLVRILLSGIDCPLDIGTAAMLGHASNEPAQAWMARDAAWRGRAA